MSKKPKGFNTPFAELEALKLKLLAEEAAAKAAEKAAAKAAALAATRKPAPIADSTRYTTSDGKPMSDEQAFYDEMMGVAPLAPDPRGRHNVEPSIPPLPRRRADDEAEAYAELADLIDGAGIFDISATDEYIEGLGPGIDKRLLRKLRAGDYAIQTHLDLHGFTSDEARLEVETFLTRARTDGRRCVLIVHGRGHNSKEGIPVLKERLKVWLTRGRIGQGVLAFCTARPVDGGAGAVYVLLRR